MRRALSRPVRSVQPSTSTRRLLTHFSPSIDVVLATYEALEKNIHVFQNVQRWDCLVVDEGQRLKAGDGNALHDALKTLTINHRILLSGTPLNNNIVELFNLLSFIGESLLALGPIRAVADDGPQQTPAGGPRRK